MMKWAAEKLSIRDQEDLIRGKLKSVLNVCLPLQVILIGSASRGEMTTASDVDLVVIVGDEIDQRRLVRELAKNRPADDWPQDILLVSASHFAERSAIGGIYWIAKTEGIEIYPINHLRLQDVAKENSGKEIS